jgi:4-amino-4-deoxy-L-arabinose transferase-like glycosyltransferase
MLMQFGASTILLTMVSQMKPESNWWQHLLAAAAALGFGTKYPGGLLIVPVLLSSYLLWDKKSYRSLISSWVKSIFIFAGVYLLTTPATIIQPVEFLKGVLYEINHYSTGHAGHTVSPGLQHGWRMFVYFSSVFFSHYALVAFSSSPRAAHRIFTLFWHRFFRSSHTLIITPLKLVRMDWC